MILHMLGIPVVMAAFVGGIGVCAEIVAIGLKNVRVRKLAYLCSLVSTLSVAILVIATSWNLAGLFFFGVSIWRVFNAVRVLYGRTQEERSYLVSRRTSVVLLLLQFASVALLAVVIGFEPSTNTLLAGMLSVSFLAVVIMNFALNRTLARASIRTDSRPIPDSELPSVSVCIPARNETEDLIACLQSIIASEYPKLEILVLDDCSQQQTSEIIKGFAHQGVRFLAGEPVRSGWLAKNQAYQALADAASGEYLIFCGVDVRLDKKSIKSIVKTLRSRKKLMLSVLPHGADEGLWGTLVQPMRYWWELALPRRPFNRPPALSTFWAIKREALTRTGGFKAVNNMVIPESYFARELARQDGYSFVRSDELLQISSAKRFPEQWQTAVRTRYPQLRKRPESVFMLIVAELIIFVLPVSLFVAGFFLNLGYIWTLSALTTLLLGVIHYRIVHAWHPGREGLALLAMPASFLIEIYSMLLSMYKYELSTVTWKERNICIPVMRVTRRLPHVS